MARPEELKDDEILEICRRLGCRLDRASMAATCRTWAASLARIAAAPLVRQLPLLFFPTAAQGAASFSCLSCGGVLHNIALLPDGITNARLIGSHPHWWWIAATGYVDGHVLSNMVSGRQVQLPDTMRIGRDNIIENVRILAVSLSAIPNDQVPAAQCYGAALVKRTVLSDVMFWRLDHQVGLSSRTVALDWARSAADVMYDNGVFKFLTESERLVFVDPVITDGGDVELNADVWAPVVDVPEAEPLDQHTIISARYLVVSRGDLLMVRRYHFEFMHTTLFRVYRLELLHLGESPEEDRYRWVQLADLGGRMLFVARGCSLAFDVNDFDDYPAAVEGIYFKGDADEFAEGWFHLGSIDREIMLSDCGRWSFPGDNEQCFQIPPLHQGPKDHSAAAWLVL